MAPEHLRAAFPPQPPDEPDQGDPRSDVYAMGAMLYEALTGRLPFPGDLTPGARPSAKQLADLDDQQRAGPTGVRQLNRRVDRGLARLVERCLAYDPADRPRSAAELGAALRRNSSSPMARASRWGRIHRGLVAVATTLVCVIALGAAGWRATLEPYAVRQLRAGWAAYDHHDAEGAIDRFQRAIGAADPLSEAQLADAYRGRGQSRMVARQFKEAGEDLFLAYQETKDAKLLDAIVYCNVQTGSNETAIGMANSLLSSSYDSAALRNNLGMAYSRMGLLPDALVSFKAAAEMRPLSGLVMRNLAWCQFKSCVKDRIATTEEMVTEIDRALQSERSPSAELYFNAACIVAWTADAQSRGPEIIEHLRHALARGLRLDRLESDLIPTWLRDEPDFVELTNSPECDGDGAPPQFLVNPLEDGYGIGNLRATEAKKNFAP
jgi:tetratricopeptide (TPR) repeat protein